MKGHIAIVVLILLAISGVPDAVAQSHADHEHMQAPDTAEVGDALTSHSLPTLTWMPRKGMLITVDTEHGRTAQIIENADGALRSFAGLNDPITGISINPIPSVNRILYSQATTQGEAPQIFLYDLSAGERRRISDGVSSNGGASWSPLGDRFAFSTTSRNGTDWDIHLADAKTGEPTPLLERDGQWFTIDWSADGRYLLAGRAAAPEGFHPVLLEVASKKPAALHDTSDAVVYRAARLGADGRSLHFIAADDDGRWRLFHRDLVTGVTRTANESVTADVTRLDLSPDGSRLAFVTQEAETAVLRVVDTTAGDESTPLLPRGTIRQISFSPDGSRLGIVNETPGSGLDILVIDVESGEIDRWIKGSKGESEHHTHHHQRE